MGSVGINRQTGQVITDFDHVIQSLGVIFETHFGERCMRRTFGSQMPGMLGKNIVPATILNFVTAAHIAISLWEPRFRLIQATFPGNSAGTIRAGRLGIALYGEYRPNALSGDLTPAGRPQTIFL